MHRHSRAATQSLGLMTTLTVLAAAFLATPQATAEPHSAPTTPTESEENQTEPNLKTPQAAPTELIVSFTQTTNNMANAQQLSHALPGRTDLRRMSLGKIAVPVTATNYKALAQKLRSLPGVASVETNAKAWPTTISPQPASANSFLATKRAKTKLKRPTSRKPQNSKPKNKPLAQTDPLRDQQWALDPNKGGAGKPLGTLTKPTTIAVLDTGSSDHPDLNAAWLPGADLIRSVTNARDGDGRDLNARDEGDYRTFQDCPGMGSGRSSWHGSHVAGIIAATKGNGIGITGAAPGTKILPVRVLGRCGGFVSDIADGIVWAVGGKVPGLPINKNRAKILNLSLGGIGWCSRTYQDAINYARSRGAVVVVSAGNDGRGDSMSSPANCQGTVTVAATTKNWQLADYSNYGKTVDIAAPGGDWDTGGGVLSTVLSSRKRPQGKPTYAPMYGTSMAAPHVSALVAHMLAANPSLSADAVEKILGKTAHPYDDGWCVGCRGGIINPARAVAAAKEHTTPTLPTNLLPHGTFETRRTDWHPLRPGIITNRRNVKPHRGHYAAVLGGRGKANTSHISTTVSIPANATTARLSYWLRVDSAETRTKNYDNLKVSLNGYHLATHSNRAPRGRYRRITLDVSGYRGQTIPLSFDVREDGRKYTRFTLDDVTLTVR